MRILKVAALCLSSVLLFRSLGFARDVFEELSSLDKDKYVHFGAGVLLSHVSYPIFKKYVHDRKKAMWYSILFTAAVATGKEVYDSRKTVFDGGDLAASTLGGLTIVVVEF